MITTKAIEQHIQPAVTRALQPSGFTRDTDGSWRRCTGGVLGCVEIQLRSDRSSFCINLGTHFDFLPTASGGRIPENLRSLRQPDCELGSRLERNGQEVWWSNPEHDAEDVAVLLISNGIPFLSEHLNVRASLGGIAPENIDEPAALRLTASLTSARRHLLFARVHEHLGNRTWALQIAEMALARNPASGVRVQLRRLIERLSH